MKTSRLFEEVDLHGKANLLWEKGELITTIDYYNQKVRLYLLKDFFAELFYNPIINKITRIEKTNSNSIKKFLPYIEIDFNS